MLKNVLKIICLFFLTNCSPRISPYFNNNKVIKNEYTHVINDSLNYNFKLFGSYNPVINKRDVRKSFHNKKYLNGKDILFYGLSSLVDSVELYITISDKRQLFKNLPRNTFIIDTINNNNVYTFIKINTKEDPYRNVFFGSDVFKSIPSVDDIVSYYENSNKYLMILKYLETISQYKNEDDWKNLQLKLTYSSFLGDTKKFHFFREKLFNKIPLKKNENIEKVIKEEMITENVLEKIAEEADFNNIIMINENHFFPDDRLLLYDLLPLLKKKGYTYLALEALNSYQDSIMNLPNSYPTQKSGFYIREQNFSNVVRLAKKLGYKFVSYDSSEKNRELRQAENLYNNTFMIDPNAKVIVWGGLSHIYEKKDSSKKYMASIFYEKYKINPLTISQTQLIPYKNLVESDYGLIEGEKIEFYKKVKTDYLLINNRERELQRGEDFKNTYGEGIQLACFYLDEINKNYDYRSRVPFFTIFIDINKTEKLPLISDREYIIYIFNDKGEVLDKIRYK